MLSDPVVQEVLMDITNDEKDSVLIIECILGGKTSDMEIAEQTEIKLNIVRKLLYKLHGAGITTYKKIKDPETNLYIYNWKFDQNKVSEIIAKKYEDFISEIEKNIQYEEENMFFACAVKGHRYMFQTATENNFICPICGESLEHQDNSLIIVELLKQKAAYLAMAKSNENDWF